MFLSFFLSFFLSLCVCVFVCVFVCLIVGLFVCLRVCLFGGRAATKLHGYLMAAGSVAAGFGRGLVLFFRYLSLSCLRFSCLAFEREGLTFVADVVCLAGRLLCCLLF